MFGVVSDVAVVGRVGNYASFAYDADYVCKFG